ncbi:neurotrypsin-like, partial [Mizuhopecten yessoensis]|uniref:neurotrypsin-like n=1 Tax=Mizuhopecten yessoensis TaxID=6573 RepID=UPI000B45A214
MAGYDYIAEDFAFVLTNLYSNCSGQAPQHVRLVGGKHQGRLEVYHDGVWGTVCDDGATNTIAKVVCRQLDITSAYGIVEGSAHFGAGTGRIWMDDVLCNGNELSLDACTSNGWGNHNCGHGEDLSVVCGQYVTRVKPNSGSLSGGTRVTIEGAGFSKDPFNHFPGTEHH